MKFILTITSAALPKASMYTPIADDNKGARMLAQMGWKKGEGLGKDGTGIIDPVKAETYGQSAGIGSTVKRDAGDGSYRTRTANVVSEYFLFYYLSCIIHIIIFCLVKDHSNTNTGTTKVPW